MSLTQTILSTLPGNALDGLRRVDGLWRSLREKTLLVSPVVKTVDEPLEAIDYDVVICGGTLGILMGCALAQRGWRVALIERGILRGRDQEWNISRQELTVLVEMGLLTESELEQAIVTDYNPARIRFLDGAEFWVTDVLNIGVDPVFLLATLKTKFLASGGRLFENCGFVEAIVHPNGVNVLAKETLTTRVLLDAMGHFSPIAHQARKGQHPDAVCLVVGTCAQGFPNNETGDLFAAFTPLHNHCQYFWEAFPARDGRTTYLFTYLDTANNRPNLEDLFEEYFRLLPEYQSIQMDQLQFKRALYGIFPSYRQSPLQYEWDRILAIGDSSGSQSPLSFGGFGAMMRHLRRLTHGIDAALTSELLDRKSLSLLQPYQPNLSVTWLFQKAMSARIDQTLPPEQINQLLSAVFGEMSGLGDRVLKPFLQDVVQFSALSQTLVQTAIKHPALVLRIIPQVGIPALTDWIFHYGNLGIYTGLYSLLRSAQPWTKHTSPKQQYFYQRWIDALQYGTGSDYHQSDPY